jgi:hypothetical protein
MPTQRKRETAAVPPTPLEKLPELRDPIERAAHAEQLIAYARDRADQAMAIRNEAIREARKTHEARTIADMTGISLPTVRVVCR